jgi:hypothetical protein
MHKVEKTGYGFKLTFADFIKPEEMKVWLGDSQKALAGAPKEFGVFVDMRTLKPLTPDTQATMEEGQKLFKQKGMVRSVVILANSVLTMQFKRIAKETGIYQWERYIDANADPKWEQAGIDWLVKGTDPDK